MRKIAFLLLFLPALCTEGRAQDYQVAVGARAGMAFGISGKYFITRYGALEGILTTRWKGANFTALAEFHLPVFDTEGFYFYYGGGLHTGAWDHGVSQGENDSGLEFFGGIDGIVGLEYVFRDVPVCVGLDWKPGFHLVTHTRFVMDEIALNLRVQLD